MVTPPERNHPSFMGSPQKMGSRGGPQIPSFALNQHRNTSAAQKIVSYPLSKTQAIARYREEMMVQVKQMPEETYELSLRDIVELPKAALERSPEKERESGMEKEKSPKMTKEKGDNSRRAGKWKDRILVLKVIGLGSFPSKLFLSNHFRGKRKSVTEAAKVSPKPVLFKGEELMKAEASKAENTSRKMVGCNPFLPMSRGH